MRQSRTFLVVSDASERLSLIATTLHRKFPNSAVLTCRESHPALAIAQSQPLDAIVASGCSDLDELPLVQRLREVASAPILMMSMRAVEDGARAAGAAAYLHASRWLLAGTVVAQMLGVLPPAEE